MFHKLDKLQRIRQNPNNSSTFKGKYNQTQHCAETIDETKVEVSGSILSKRLSQAPNSKLNNKLNRIDFN